MTDPLALAAAVAEVGPLADAGKAARALGLMQAMKEWVKVCEAELKAGLIELVRANGGRFVVGATEFRVGTPAENKCRDLRAAVEAVLNGCGGDFDTFVACLSANALKPGECRKVLGDEWDAHFEVVRKEKLVAGERKEQLIEVDTRFIQRRPDGAEKGSV